MLNVLQSMAEGYSNFRPFPQKTGTKLSSINPQLFVLVIHVHAVAVLFCNSLCDTNSLRKEADHDGSCLPIKSGEKFQLNYTCISRYDINILTV